MPSIILVGEAVQRDVFAFSKPLVQGLAMGNTSTASAGRQLDAGHSIHSWQVRQLHCAADLAGDQKRLRPSRLRALLAHLRHRIAAVRSKNNRRCGKLYRGKECAGQTAAQQWGQLNALLYMEAAGVAGDIGCLWGGGAV